MPGTECDRSRLVELGGYDFRLPESFAEPEIRSTDEYVLLKTAASPTITFDIFVIPEGGDAGVDRYFGTALNSFEHGNPRRFDLQHMGLSFRGWFIDECPKLSESPGSFIQFYGTVANGDAVCFSWASFEALEHADKYELLFLTIVFGGVASGAPTAS